MTHPIQLKEGATPHLSPIQFSSRQLNLLNRRLCRSYPCEIRTLHCKSGPKVFVSETLRNFRGSGGYPRQPLAARPCDRLAADMRPTIFALAGIFFLAGFSLHAQDSARPHLEKRGAATQLVVDGKPFLMLAGELHNSCSSSLEYMKPEWPKLAAIPLNTVLTPLSWELVEPTEGKYDFALVDGLLAQAREQHLHIVFLWLASWKNGMSSYDPVWVKQDTKRFPRAVENGNEVEHPQHLRRRDPRRRCARLRRADAASARGRWTRSHRADDAGRERSRRPRRHPRSLRRSEQGLRRRSAAKR